MDSVWYSILLIVFVVRIECQLDNGDCENIEEPWKESLPVDTSNQQPDVSTENEKENVYSKNSDTTMQDINLESIREIFGFNDLKRNEKERSTNLNIALSFKTPDVDGYPFLNNYLDPVKWKHFDKDPEYVEMNIFDLSLKDETLGDSLFNKFRMSLTDNIQRIKQYLLLSDPDNRKIMANLESVYGFTSHIVQRDEEINSVPAAFIYTFHPSTKDNLSGHLTHKNPVLNMVEHISEDIFMGFFGSDMGYFFKNPKLAKRIKITGENKLLKKLYKKNFTKLMRTMIQDYELNTIPLNCFAFFAEKLLEKIERAHNANLRSKSNVRSSFNLPIFQNPYETSGVKVYPKRFENYMEYLNDPVNFKILTENSELLSKMVEDESFLSEINEDFDVENKKEDPLQSSIGNLKLLLKMFNAITDLQKIKKQTFPKY